MKLLLYFSVCAVVLVAVLICRSPAHAADEIIRVDEYRLQSGHQSLTPWVRPPVEHPEGNLPNRARRELGKMLFFDPRLSRSGSLSCAGCHNPMFGWTDGLPTARGDHGQKLARATPSVRNSGYEYLHMWDGRIESLEAQALEPLKSGEEMAMPLATLVQWLKSTAGYRAAFARAYPEEAISAVTLSKALGVFQRSIVSPATPFDRWVAGDAAALSAEQVRGFAVFLDSRQGNCVSCHAPPHFSDMGFHNIGVEDKLGQAKDEGRFSQVPIALMRGAFKTPVLRDVGSTAPYFHDGSALTLQAVIDHYEGHHMTRENLSPTLKVIDLDRRQERELLSFLAALNSPTQAVELPYLPQSSDPIPWRSWSNTPVASPANPNHRTQNK